MAIPLPNPNINDFDTNDVQTWSSNKLKEGFEAVGGSVGSDGEVNAKTYSLVKEVTLESAVSSYELADVSYKNVFVVITFTADSNSTPYIYLRFKTPEGGSSYFVGPGLARGSATSGSTYVLSINGTCNNGLIMGDGFFGTDSIYGTVQRHNSPTYFSNILGSVFTSVQIYSNISLPVGTNIKIYAY